MSQRAIVTSVEAIEAFRAQLLVYISKARPAIEEVSADVMRMREWLDHEQRNYLENQLRRRSRELDEAQQALFSSRISNFRTETSAELLQFQRAKRAVEAAENKLRTLKQWNKNFDGQVQPLVKQMEKIHTVLSHDLTQAVALLAQTALTLEAYTEIKVPTGESEAGPPASAIPASAKESESEKPEKGVVP